jgi:4-hydroxy-tetrahydrodipicolinate synthase
MPVVIYNVPGRTSSNISAETTIRLARDVENIVAVKKPPEIFRRLWKSSQQTNGL